MSQELLNVLNAKAKTIYPPLLLEGGLLLLQVRSLAWPCTRFDPEYRLAVLCFAQERGAVV